MATKVSLICKNCKKEFIVNKGKEKKTCSTECRKNLRKKNDEKFYIEKQCNNCGETFSSKKKDNKKYCSYKCSGEAKKKISREKRNCKECGKEFEERKKYKREFCGENCRLIWQKKRENIETRIQKSKKSLINKYGVDSPLKVKEIKEKAIDSIRKTYHDRGDKILLKTRKIIEKNRNDKLTQRFSKIGYKIVKFCDDGNIIVRHPDGHEFKDNRKIIVNRLNHNVELSTKLLPLSAAKSTLELKISKFLNNENVKFITNTRDIIKNKELDIYILKHKLAIELNGLYWHSEYYVDEDYHLNKTESAKGEGIELIHIFEDEIIEKFDIVKSIIKSKLEIISNKIYARKCEIKEISSKESKQFLDENHIQGNVNSSIKLGLYHNDKLVSLMTFGKKRKSMGGQNIDDHYEMYRFCNKLDTSVIGGASKLFKYFINNYKPKEVISYADRRYFDGKMYENLGFKFVSFTKPNYYYVVNKTRKHRFNFRKDKLIKEGYDKTKTEREIMGERKIPRIYDCGNIKYIFQT